MHTHTHTHRHTHTHTHIHTHIHTHTILTFFKHIYIHFINQKRKEREAAVLRNKKLTKEQQEKWLQVMRNEMMSSEESDVDEEGEGITVVHLLVWRSKYCSSMFSKIDKYSYSFKSAFGRRQTKRRKYGSPSSRPLPPGVRSSIPEWAVEENID